LSASTESWLEKDLVAYRDWLVHRAAARIRLLYEPCYISAVISPGEGDRSAGDDPTLESAIGPLKDLLSAMDAAIGRLYAERGVAGVRPRFSMALIRLQHRGPMTVKELAGQIDVTHSAMSQTITAMRREGLVETSTGSDARTRTVALTDRGRALVPFLEAEWRATERAWAELEAELPYALTQVVDDITAALQRRSFLDRITQQLDRPPGGEDEPRRASGDQPRREHRA
jgi:DNA-binding MarR family transcriptional regulator